uniref:Uncharacterized protein n=1 Tax=Daphnia galeata TaxID=27404 RepID=A0A8J2RCW2_9CRUS|nr:unnamed protein product [Daphnia galeata]
MGKVAPKKNDGAVNKVKISTEKKAALSEQKNVERLKRKSEKRRMLSNPLNLRLRSLYGDFKDNEQDNDDKKPIQRPSKKQPQQGKTTEHATSETKNASDNIILKTVEETQIQPELQHGPESECTTFETADSQQQSLIEFPNIALEQLLDQMEVEASAELEAAQSSRNVFSCEKKKTADVEFTKADNMWEERQEEVYVTVLTSHASSGHERICDAVGCKNMLKDHHIRCEDCRHHYCWSCDNLIHYQSPFHKRIFYKNENSRVLDLKEFINSKGSLYQLAVPVPVFKPPACKGCLLIVNNRNTNQTALSNEMLFSLRC